MRFLEEKQFSIVKSKDMKQISSFHTLDLALLHFLEELQVGLRSQMKLRRRKNFGSLREPDLSELDK